MSEKNGRWSLLPAAGNVPASLDGQWRGGSQTDHIDKYLARGGYAAAKRVVSEQSQADVLGLLEKSGLRGLGGGGFPVARKWRAALANEGPRYLVANAYDADPAAPLCRALLETNPHALLEGIVIAAHALGVQEAWVYAKSENSAALRRLRAAVAEAEEQGYLGLSAFGGKLALQVHIFASWGGFAGGEETAALEAIEGQRAMPRQKPPFPTESGLWGRPTVVHSAETLANLPHLAADGAEAFGKGSKLLALGGDVAKPGLVEVPFGTPLRQILTQWGGGPAAGQSPRAVQIGGPTGAVLPESLLDTPLGHDALREVGAFVGSGSLRVLGEKVCMVDFARGRMDYLAHESCGKCVPCRLGTNRLTGVLETIMSGLGRKDDLALLDEFGNLLSQSSLCGFGLTAPTVLRTTMTHFAEDYRVHIEEGRCPTATCRALRTRGFERKAAV